MIASSITLHGDYASGLLFDQGPTMNNVIKCKYATWVNGTNQETEQFAETTVQQQPSRDNAYCQMSRMRDKTRAANITRDLIQPQVVFMECRGGDLGQRDVVVPSMQHIQCHCCTWVDFFNAVQDNILLHKKQFKWQLNGLFLFIYFFYAHFEVTLQGEN